MNNTQQNNKNAIRKEHHKETKRQYRIKNKDAIRQKDKEYRLKNKEKHKEYCLKNKEQIRKKSKEYQTKNKDILKEKRKIYYINNKKRNNQTSKDYKLKNKEKVKLYNKEYSINRRKHDPKFKILGNLRGRIRRALKNNKKCDTTLKFIGCSVNELKLHLEKQFKEGMTWDNYGFRGWHIDHILPCASFDMSEPEEQQKCFHYTNLQPLWWWENLAKSNKIV